KIFVVGLGPGEQNQMTSMAMEALEQSQVIIGYTVYIDLIKDKFGHKKLMSTPMKKEVDRCKMVLDEALKGQTVSLVCSGD
ncbi:SAM-dependent methyltransferase, partial [Acinetobacter sp. 163]|nr:SAM-dependent methyltransferase [Acinetobacter sp. 163]